MKSMNSRKGISALFMIIAIIIIILIFVLVVIPWISSMVASLQTAVGKGTGLGQQIKEKIGILGEARACENIEVNVSDCYGAHPACPACNSSCSRGDWSNYSVYIPLTTTYEAEIELEQDSCWADDNQADYRANTSNDPEYCQDCYLPLIYKFFIDGALIRDYRMTDHNDEYINITINLDKVTKGNHEFAWRIATDWYDDGTKGTGCSDAEKCDRNGYIKRIKLSCR